MTLRSGVATVVCDGVQTILTPRVALWVSDGGGYALDLRTRAQLRILYAKRACAGTQPASRTEGPVKLTPLLRELIERAVVRGHLDPRQSGDAHLLAVIDDELSALAPEPGAAALVLPRTAAIRAAVERSVAVPDRRVAIGELAGECGLSQRTFIRYFVRETGLTPREWLRRARLAAAAIVLASGASVTEAGLASGYASISAFIAAYRAVFGDTPGAARAAGPSAGDERAAGVTKNDTSPSRSTERRTWLPGASASAAVAEPAITTSPARSGSPASDASRAAATSERSG